MMQFHVFILITWSTYWYIWSVLWSDEPQFVPHYYFRWFWCKIRNCYKHNKMAYRGAKVNGFTTQFRLPQIIKEPTHILAKSSSCVKLIYMSHQKLVIESGAHSSLHPNCHHQIKYAKFDLKITTHHMNVKYGIMIKQMLIN